MLSVNSYGIAKIDENTSSIIADFDMHSPCCSAEMRCFGKRSRFYINEEGVKQTLIIRRMQCKNCKKIHHELPDILVPYKRHCSESIQNIIDDKKIQDIEIICEITTINRIKRWFHNLADRFLERLQHRRARFPLPSDLKIESIDQYRGQKNWLKNLVWELANHHLWIQPAPSLVCEATVL